MNKFVEIARRVVDSLDQFQSEGTYLIQIEINQVVMFLGHDNRPVNSKQDAAKYIAYRDAARDAGAVVSEMRRNPPNIEGVCNVSVVQF